MGHSICATQPYWAVHFTVEDNMTLKIDFYLLGLNNPTISAWFKGMYESFFDGLRQVGCQVTYSKLVPNMQADLLVVPLGGRQDQSSAQAMQAFGGPVALYVPPASEWFRVDYLRRWKNQVLFAYGTDFSSQSTTRYADLGIPYHCVPFASMPAIMKPLSLPKLYDIVFVGNPGSGKGRHEYVKLVIASQRHKVLLIGPGWERYGFAAQSIAWGDMLNILYNLSHVCINIHNDQQRIGPEVRLDANNRLFDLAMAGCFQISNAPEVVREYFNPSEVIAIDDPQEWAATIMHYLDHPEETEPFRIAARKRALAEHTWDQRATQFVGIVETHLSAWHSGVLTLDLRARRLRDTLIPPNGVAEVVSKVARRLRLPGTPGK